MPPTPSSQTSRDETSAPSREEIEIICLLQAVGTNPCTVSELTERLGLSRLLGSALVEAMQTLVSKDWLSLRDDQLALTDAGRFWLNERLSRYHAKEPSEMAALSERPMTEP